MTAPDSQLDTIEKDRAGQMPTTQAPQGFHALPLFEGSTVAPADLLRAPHSREETQSRVAFLAPSHHMCSHHRP